MGIKKNSVNKRRRLSIIIISCTLLFLIFGSIMQYTTLKKFRNIPIANIDTSAINDGTYNGQSTFGSFTYKVSVVVLNHTIMDIKIIQNRQSDYARFAEGVVSKIIKAQKTNVEAITEATTTSKCILKAVKNALTQSNK